MATGMAFTVQTTSLLELPERRTRLPKGAKGKTAISWRWGNLLYSLGTKHRKKRRLWKKEKGRFSWVAGGKIRRGQNEQQNKTKKRNE